MKKYLISSVVVLVMISLSGCQFNIFTELDKIEIPNAAELLVKAQEDPTGFVSDVQDYVDSDSITENNTDDIINALETVYTTKTGETGERAAVLAGEISIDSDPDTKLVINNIVSSLTEAMDSDDDPDPEAIISGIFPSDMTQAEFSDILANLSTAAAAYEDFAASIDGVPADGIANPGSADWMSSAEAGDMVQYAVVAIIITDINTTVPIPELYNSVMYGADIPDSKYDDPFSSLAMKALLDFAGLDFGE